MLQTSIETSCYELYIKMIFTIKIIPYSDRILPTGYGAPKIHKIGYENW